MQPNLGQSAPTGISNPATASPSTLQQAASAAEAKALQDTLAPSAAQAAVRQEGPNQFQRFVQSSTGRLLPVFGHDFFTSPGNYASNSALPVPDDYQLGPGDEVILRVTGPVDFATNLVIDRNGQVTLPKVGTVTLTGTRARDLNKTLSQALAKVFTNFSASATLGRLRAIQVYVVGQARRPGTFQLSSLSTLVNALFASGGPGNNGSMRAIELKRDGITLTTIDLYDFIARGDKAQDRALMNGDVIFIPPAGPRMAVTGAIDQAAIYELKPGQNTIESILSLSGGVSVIASARKAQWERIDPKQNPQRVVQTVTLDKPGMQNILQDGDVLTLFGVSPAFANAVTLQGNVASPLRYSWFEGMRILDLIPERDALITADYYKRKNLLVQFDDQTKDAGAQINNQVRNLFDQINWDYAVIQRLDKKTLASQLIPFNLGQAVLEKNPSQNLPLLAGDVVTVLGQSDIRVPLMRQSRLVRIEGEVRAPGIYQVSAGETLPQLLIRAGGLTPQAYLFGTEFKRESVRQQQQQNVDKLIRRLESQSLSQQSYSVANRATDANGASQAALILQQQQAQLKDQISRLKSLKSNGRVALELDPQSSDLAALPPMALEDADHITIPPTPGFVSALGSVNNENVFIFRAGKTVGDVLKSAGLTEESDPSQAFVLRADGSIVAKSSTSGFFGSSFDTLPLMPGDTVVVPAQLDRESRYTSIVRGVKDWTQILSNFGIGAAALKSLGY
jgi:protein involved in polysaccharide export with SLBB domain